MNATTMKRITVVMIVGVLCLLCSGCHYAYSYREKEDSEWSSAGDYRISVNIINEARMVVAYLPEPGFSGTESRLGYLNHTLVIEPYFHYLGEIPLLDQTDDFDSKYYSLEGNGTWKSDMPINISLHYQIDSSGVQLQRRYKLTLKKHTHSFFSVH